MTILLAALLLLVSCQTSEIASCRNRIVLKVIRKLSINSSLSHGHSSSRPLPPRRL